MSEAAPPTPKKEQSTGMKIAAVVVGILGLVFITVGFLAGINVKNSAIVRWIGAIIVIVLGAAGIYWGVQTWRGVDDPLHAKKVVASAGATAASKGQVMYLQSEPGSGKDDE
jgi:uncharacterized membrane protein